MIKVAVLLTTFNGQSWLKEQLDSILSQKNIALDVYASDDLSSDQSLEIIHKCAKNVSNIFALGNDVKFGSAAQNFFRLIRDADLSDYAFVAFSDQDDIWQADKLFHAVKKIQESNVDAYSSNVTAFWPNGKQKLINKAQPQQQWDYMFESAGPGCTFVITKKLALAIQQFLTVNQDACRLVALHDWFIYAYARSHGYKWLIDKASHMHYRQHAENVVGANVGFKAKLARWKKLRDGWLVEQALLIAYILGYGNALAMQKLSRYAFVDRLWLILNVTKLRRRWRDRVAFAVFLLLPLKR